LSETKFVLEKDLSISSEEEGMDKMIRANLESEGKAFLILSKNLIGSFA
jgi:hypothetical protein